jgi:hypothetical protein
MEIRIDTVVVLLKEEAYRMRNAGGITLPPAWQISQASGYWIMK